MAGNTAVDERVKRTKALWLPSITFCPIYRNRTLGEDDEVPVEQVILDVKHMTTVK